MTHGLRDAMTEHVGELAARVQAEAGPLVERAASSAVPVVDVVSDAVSDVFDASRVRGGAALLALRGERVLPPAAARRWPWAVGAAVVGAAAGAAVALLVGRLIGTDAPDAQEPEELEAVVDRPAMPG